MIPKDHSFEGFPDDVDDNDVAIEQLNRNGMQIFFLRISKRSWVYNLFSGHIEDSREKHRLFSAVETIPSYVTRKATWALNWIQRRFIGFRSSC
ncbi:hypothetical protein MKX01_040295 [Papaver californicum]|nr:hypothetical protein MKX01_040295 [Papaver californicum]